MAGSVLSKDIVLWFPHFIVLKASAGSGKTYALSQRFAQFILSEKIPKNHLRNTLAITFSNNAAKEMKDRIIRCLKSLYFGETEMMNDFISLVSLDKEDISKKAEELIDEILGNYSDFQVKTIDSFMASIFKASAIDFGYNPDFEIVMNNDSFMEYSFNLFLRKVKEGSAEAALLDDVIKKIHEQKQAESSFLWDPSTKLLEELKKIYLKIASAGKTPAIEDYSTSIKDKCEEIKNSLEVIESEINKLGLERNNISSFKRILQAVRNKQFTELIGAGLKTPPVKKQDKKSNKQVSYAQIVEMWSQAVDLIKNYINLYSRSYYMPYLSVYAEFNDIIEKTKRYQCRVFIGDINYYLASYLESQIVPDIYFRLGEKIYHFLIDEFQDTSPIQWNILNPLIENSLALDGSLFVVGDTKQAIYGFRDADYSIMKKCETQEVFPSAKHIVSELSVNFRSLPEILRFNELIFKEKTALEPKYAEPAKRSGLNDYKQHPRDNVEEGYVRFNLIERDEEYLPEKQRFIEIIKDILQRGYTQRDIAILAPQNDDVVMVTKWLNENDIDFISMSSLDVRQRKTIREIISLISFLDSPIDDLSFAAFISGEVFRENLKLNGIDDAAQRIQDFLFSSRDLSPLYKAFHKEFESLWKIFFEDLFRLVGYLPLYEIIIGIIKTFRLFEIKRDEEAAIVKILEAVKKFETYGLNNVRDFLDFASLDSTSSEWDIALPSNIDAVKVMTIHKSKGLGFPVVIVLLYGDSSKGFDYLFEESGDKVRLIKINQKIAEGDPMLNQIYYEERVKETVNKLNSLYVGFTRAERELYVLGIKRQRDSYPFDLMPANDCEWGKQASSVQGRNGNILPHLNLIHHCEIFAESPIESKRLNLQDRLWGEYIHRVLSFISYVSEGFDVELREIIESANKEMMIEHSYSQIQDIVMNIVNHSSLKDLFRSKHGRSIKNEMEIVSSAGRLFRIDRVVTDENTAAVIEYKTGLDVDANDEHTSQLKNYMKLLREIYPETIISGKIIYIDMRDINIIEVK